MEKKRKSAILGLGASLTVFTVGACGGIGTNQNAGAGSAALGKAIDGLTVAQKAEFDQGKEVFSDEEGVANGIGPVFNSTSCVSCHSEGGVGGSSPNITFSRVTRIGCFENGSYSDMVDKGGPVLQARSIKDFDPTVPFGGEIVPPEAQFVSHRMTTPLFGAGLIEAIPDETILARTSLLLPDGIHGTANRSTNLLTGKQEIGRFGWKAQVSNLSVFAADAYLNEMGITTPLFPNENLPQGHSMPAGIDNVGDPEDAEDVELFAQFMRFLAPPAPKVTLFAADGEALFKTIGCANCHVPTMKTGPNAVAALSNKDVNLYSDLLVHHMGPGLDDGVEQGDAKGDMWRTAPLWGLSRRVFYLHDGRATSLGQAIAHHDGEARIVRERFEKLNPSQKENLYTFLSSL